MDPSPALPFDLERTLAWRGEFVRERVAIGDREFLIDRPAVDSPSPSPVGDQPPSWVELWPAARMLAKAIRGESWPPGTDALEIGCGLGLPGIVALSMGLRVTFSDCDPMALQFAAANARLNGFSDFQTLHLDWRSPPMDLRAGVILASDPVFEVQQLDALVNFVKQTLATDGVCLMTAQDRLASARLQKAMEAGLAVATRVVRAAGADGKQVKGLLYRIQKVSPKH